MKTLFRYIGLFFKGIWKGISFIRLALTNIVFLLVIGVMYFSFTQTQKALEPPTLDTQSALVLNLSGPIVEQTQYINPMDSFTGSLLGDELPQENLLFDIVDTIRYAKDDDNITGLVLSLKEMQGTSLTKLRYIAKAINEFKTTGKPVYAIGDFYTQSQYYLASYADKVFLSKDGGIYLRGFSAYNLYYKTLLENLDVSTHVFRVGTYKSAIEPFIRDDMSPEAREAMTSLLDQQWSAYTQDIANNRNIDVASITPDADEFIKQLKRVNGDAAALAYNLGLVDQLGTRQDVRKALADAFGERGHSGYQSISYYDYQATMRPQFGSSQDDVAIVVASGTILDGYQPRGTIGGDTVAEHLRRALNDSKVKSVVLRVDSPGGSAFASEVIRNEIQALREAGKPVVVSMSSMAASGGYWISMSADKIIAQPTTITGSIGIFGVLTTVEKGINKLGVYADGVATSPFSADGLTTGLSKASKQVIQLGVESGYKRFIGLVGANRNMSLEEVDNVAQGRVWTGADALKLGLVDQMGDFDDAVAAAAELAGLTEYNLYWVEEQLSPSELFIQELMDQIHASVGLDLNSYVPEALRPATQQIQADMTLLQSFNDPKGHYAFCLNCEIQ